LFGGDTFDKVHRTIIFCHREMDTIDVITSPDGVEMNEAAFYALWEREKRTSWDAVRDIAPEQRR
jgi:hypothetical protein